MFELCHNRLSFVELMARAWECRKERLDRTEKNFGDPLSFCGHSGSKFAMALASGLVLPGRSSQLPSFHRPRRSPPWLPCGSLVAGSLVVSVMRHVQPVSTRHALRCRGESGDRSVSRRQEVVMTLGTLGVQLPRPAAAASPTLGLGTCCLKGEVSEEQVYQGLKIGYRFIDTASHYENEASVAAAVRRSGLPREQLFLVTKIWFDDMGERTTEALQESLKRLETEYVDLLLIHFPGTNDAIQSPGRNRLQREETWRQLEAAKAQGQARSIGVANFTRRHLKEILSSCKEAPEVIQTEVHPYFQQPELLEFCRQKNLQVHAFSPLAHGELGLLEDRLLTEIALKHQRTVPQVVLRWLLQQGITPIVFTQSPKNMQENWAAVQEDWQLSERELDS
eukprot:s20_g3.t1